MVRGLADPVPEVRAACATALGQARNDHAADPLARLANDASDLSSVRVTAVQSLGSLGSVAEPALLQLVRAESGAIRTAAVSALAEVDSPAAAAALAEIAVSQTEPRALRDIAAGD